MKLLKIQLFNILICLNSIPEMTGVHGEPAFNPKAIGVLRHPGLPELSPDTTAVIRDHAVGTKTRKKLGSRKTARQHHDRKYHQDVAQYHDRKHHRDIGQIADLTKDSHKLLNKIDTTALLRNIQAEINGVSKKELRQIMRTAMCFVNGSLTPVLYDIRHHICCNGLFPRNSSSEICCAGHIIQSDTEICCTDKVFKKSETNNSECCSNNLYNPDSHICCQQKLYPRTETSSCCGQDLYDSGAQLCCFNLYVHNLTKGDTCCGMDVYDSNTQTCCAGNIQNAFGNNNNRGRCCGEQSYDARCYKCDVSYDEVVPLFNVNKRICCDGKIRRRRFIEAKCCGKNVYDAASNYTCLANRYPIVLNVTTTRSRARNWSFKNYSYASAVTIPSFYNATYNEKPYSVSSIFHSNIVFAIVSGVFVTILTFMGILTCRRKKINCYKPIINKFVSGEITQLNNRVASKTSKTNFTCNNSEVHSTTGYYSMTSKSSRHCSSMYLNMPMDVENHKDEDCFATDFSHIILTEDFYAKGGNDKNTIYVNVCDNLLVDCETQTCEPKGTNVMNIFGQPFTHTFMVDSRNGSIQMPESEETMVLPNEALKTNVIETHCSTYWDLNELCDKFVIPDGEVLASPAAEYKLIGHESLPAYAVVIKPFIGSAKNLKVYKFQSDQGLNPKSEPKEVPAKDMCGEDADCFYEIKDNMVYIFTKSFSGFFCTTCQHSRNLILTTFLYGSYKEISIQGRDKKYEVRLRLYIADEILKFKDYQQNMEKREQREGRTLKASEELNINELVVEDDELKIELSSKHIPSHWVPVSHPTKNTPMYSAVQTVKMSRIATQCQNCPDRLRETRNPYSVQWYFAHKSDCEPIRTFQCVIDIMCMSNTEETQHLENRSTMMCVDDLRPNSYANSAQDFDDPIFQEIQSYFEQMEQEKQQRLQDELCTTHRVEGDCLTRTCTLLKERFRDEKLLYQELLNALRKCNMSREIKYMETKGLLKLPGPHFPIQREQTVNEQAAVGSVTMETASLLPSNITGSHGNVHVANVGHHNVEPFSASSGYSLVAIGNTMRSVADSNPERCHGEMSQNLNSTFSGVGPPALESQPDIETQAGNILEGNLTLLYDRVGIQENASMDETQLMKV